MRSGADCEPPRAGRKCGMVSGLSRRMDRNVRMVAVMSLSTVERIGDAVESLLPLVAVVVSVLVLVGVAG